MQDPSTIGGMPPGPPPESPDDDDAPEPMTGKEAQSEEAPQIELSESEIRRLGDRVQSDFQGAINDHQRRMGRYRRYYYLWRSRIGGAGGESLKSNFKVPLTEWQLLGMLAKQSDALFGDDAQIVARPTVKTNAELSGKVGDFMTWRVFESMKAKLKILEFTFMKLMFGRAHAYVPYICDTYMDGAEEVVDYEGPGFYPLMPDDFITPAERVRTLHEFSWVIRRAYPTPDELLEGEDQGKYFGISDNFKNIVIQSQNKRPRDNRTDQVREIKEIFEGVNYYFAWSWGEILEVYEWYGNWRMLLDPKQDGELNDIDRREKHRTELLVRYIPELHQVITVQKLSELYPRMRYPRPFVESACMATGEYWGKGIPEMCEDGEIEMSANENIMTEAAERAMSPMLGVRPRSGQKLMNTRVEPGAIIELDDPMKDVNVLRLVTDVQVFASRQQVLQSYTERVTGLTDQSLGRSSTAPNQPRTARQGILMNENESVRLGLDYTVLREDWRIILERFWMLDSLYGPPEMFFRVTGKSPQGLYDIDNGFGKMTAEERAGRFDFDVEFATSEYSKEAKKSFLSEVGTLALQTPLVAQNPPAQWHILDDIYDAAGVDFSKYLPKPPAAELAMDPDTEWHMIMQHQPVHVHPADRDAEHLAAHHQQFDDMVQDKSGMRDEQALRRLYLHINAHEHQQRQKLLVAQQAQIALGMSQMLGLHPAQLPGGPQGMMPPGMGGGPNGGAPGQPSPPAPIGEPSQPSLNAPSAGALAS